MSAPARAVEQTRAWLEHAVVGLNLCPFAGLPFRRGLVHYAVSEATAEHEILDALDAELRALDAASPQSRETTLLIVPAGPHDFLEFNALRARAERQVARYRGAGRFQLASFHPRWLFAEGDEQDPAHLSNRAPHPTLHLLREDSVSRAVDALDEPSQIYESNMETLRALGTQGWDALRKGRW